MGTNNPYFPDSVKNTEEALNYIGAILQALRNGTYNAITGATPTLTAVQMVGGVVSISGGTTATATTDTAANIIARMQAVDPNAAIGSTFQFSMVNDNSGTLTMAGGTGVTLVGATATSIATQNAREYLGKWTGANAVSLSVIGI